MHRFAFIPLAALLSACSKSPSDIREWRPSDHDHTDNPNAAQADLTDGGRTSGTGFDEVALMAWRTNCVPCHGLVGRGDGPKGPAVKARNLADPEWQASVSDAQIAESIRNGKGQMPKLNLPESTVTQLVKVVRLLNPAQAAPVTDGGAPAAGDGGTARPSDAGKQPRAPGDAGKTPPAPPDAGKRP